jgi:type I restriction enzyme S subunit
MTTTWITHKLKDITTKIGSGATPRGGESAYQENGIPLIRSLNIYDLTFSYEDLAFINEEQANKLANVTVEKDDVLLNITGASVCRCTSVPEKLVPARVNQHVSIIRADGVNLSGKYLKYALVSPLYKGNLWGLATTGATREALTKEDLEKFDLKLPNLQTQTRIASVLSAYDDLIENNEKRIKALEEMAQLLYTEWFVKFKFPGHEKVKMVDSGTEYGMVPEGWAVTKLGNILQVHKGKNITRDTIVEGNVPVVAGGLAPAYYHNKPNAKGPVVTVSSSGANAGFARLYYQDIWASDCAYIDRRITEHVYYYYLFVKEKQESIFRLQRGAAQPHVYPKDLMELRIVNIPEVLIGKFQEKVVDIFDLAGNLKKHNANLSEIRDLLIPQLVTGKKPITES